MVMIVMSSIVLLGLLLLLLLCRSISALANLFVEYALSGAMLFLILFAVLCVLNLILGFFGVNDIVAVVLSIVAILFVGSIVLTVVEIGMVVLSFAVSIVSVASAFLSGALDWFAAHLDQWFSRVIGFMERQIDERSVEHD